MTELDDSGIGRSTSERRVSSLPPGRGPHLGVTLLHVACLHGHPPVVELLLLWGASPLVLDDKGRTPFDVAVIQGHTDCAQILASR